jgi:hypothetical protein
VTLGVGWVASKLERWILPRPGSGDFLSGFFLALCGAGLGELLAAIVFGPDRVSGSLFISVPFAILGIAVILGGIRTAHWLNDKKQQLIGGPAPPDGIIADVGDPHAGDSGRLANFFVRVGFLGAKVFYGVGHLLSRWGARRLTVTRANNPIEPD